MSLYLGRARLAPREEKNYDKVVLKIQKTWVEPSKIIHIIGPQESLIFFVGLFYFSIFIVMYKLSSYGKFGSISFFIGFIVFNLFFSEDILMVPSGITISGLENNLLFINKYLIDIVSGYISFSTYGGLQLWIVLIFGFLLNIALIYLVFSTIEYIVKEIKHGPKF